MTRDERPLARVPATIWLALAVLLAAQIAWRATQAPAAAAASDLPPPPSAPALRLASVVAANDLRFGVTYPWSDAARAVAAELDFVARARELAQHGAPMLLVVGAEDDSEGIIRPAEELASALADEGVEATILRIPDMAHAIADEPGLEPSPQNAVATSVNEVVAGWLSEHLS